jgi:hypothetical protein
VISIASKRLTLSALVHSPTLPGSAKNLVGGSEQDLTVEQHRGARNDHPLK